MSELGKPVYSYLLTSDGQGHIKVDEVVRCCDCERVTIDQGDHDYREPLWCSLFHIDVSLDGFCAWSKRKEESK